MTWVRVDDRFPDHPKVRGLSDRAFRAHVTGLCYACAYLTDGWVPPSVVTIKAAAELVQAGLWHETPATNGYWINDFLDYNPSREKVESDRQAKRAAGKLGGKASGEARAKQSASALVQPDREQPASEVLNTRPVPSPSTSIDVAQRSVNQRANDLAKAYHDRQPLSNFPAVAAIAKKAINAGHADAAIVDALLRLADEGRGVTVETLRVELEGLPVRRSRTPDRAAELIREAADG